MNLTDIYSGLEGAFSLALAAKDLASILEMYDNKGVLALAPQHLGVQPWQLLEKTKVLLFSEKGDRLREALGDYLPKVSEPKTAQEMSRGLGELPN